MVELKEFGCGYGRDRVLSGISFRAERGMITAVSAPSGRGKSTLLKAINRLHEMEESGFWMEGMIVADIGDGPMDIYDSSIDLARLRRKIAYIFQSPVMLPMSIEENAAFGLKLMPYDRGSIEIKVRRALEAAGLWDEVSFRLGSDAEKLSLGQKQRLAIARALVLEPPVLLFDEPSSSLDGEATMRLEKVMMELAKDRTIILVTHDREQIERLSDNTIELQRSSKTL